MNVFDSLVVIKFHLFDPTFFLIKVLWKPMQKDRFFEVIIFQSNELVSLIVSQDKLKSWPNFFKWLF